MFKDTVHLIYGPYVAPMVYKESCPFVVPTAPPTYTPCNLDFLHRYPLQHAF